MENKALLLMSVLFLTGGIYGTDSKPITAVLGNITCKQWGNKSLCKTTIFVKTLTDGSSCARSCVSTREPDGSDAQDYYGLETRDGQLGRRPTSSTGYLALESEFMSRFPKPVASRELTAGALHQLRADTKSNY